MADIIGKVISRCHLSRPLLKILRHCVEENVLDIDPDAATEFLNGLNQDPHNSAIREHKLSIPEQPQYDLDIIVPVYNVEKYVRRCIESVLNNKTKYKFRIILIDDGSTDNSAKVIDKYKHLECVKIIHQENKGFSGARNIGLAHLDSRYVTFLDSDDFLSENAINDLLDMAFDNDADIVQSGFNYVNSDGSLRNVNRLTYNLCGSICNLIGQPWGKVFRSEFFAHIKFPESYWYEDGIMRNLIYERVAKICITDRVTYNYRRNQAGITFSSKGKTKSIDSLWILLQLYEDRKKIGIETDKEYVGYILSNMLLTYRRTKALGEDVLKNIFVVYVDFYNKNFSQFEVDDEYLSVVAESLKIRDFTLFKLCGNLYG